METLRPDSSRPQDRDELREVTRQLREAQDKLLHAERMASIGQLASGVAHEINNPIGYVYSNLSTLEQYMARIFALLDRYETASESLDDPVVRHGLAEARAAADIDFLKTDLLELLAESREGITRVKKIVQDLRNFSRSAEDEPWQWADLHAGLDSTLSIVGNELKYKAKVVKQYGNLPRVQCRPSRLNQVFMNLLINAGQAIDQSGTIRIETGTLGAEIWVEVCDSGSGIKPEHLARIFDPFFTTKPVGEGTGLGLSLSYGIVQDHGGRIDVRSNPSEGTIFRVWLPMVQPETTLSAATDPLKP